MPKKPHLQYVAGLHGIAGQRKGGIFEKIQAHKTSDPVAYSGAGQHVGS